MMRSVIRDVGRPIGSAIGVPFGGASQSWESYSNEKFIELQPSAATAIDTYMNSTSPTNNYGANTTGSVGEHAAFTRIFRALIKFDLSTLPDNAIIKNCRLHLSVSSSTSSQVGNVKLYRMKRAWVEGTGTGSATGDGATWNTYDGANNWSTAGAFSETDCEQTEIGSGYTPLSIPSGYGVSLTLTPTTKAGLDLGYGWLIKTENEVNDGNTYYLSDHASAHFRPALFISYTLPEDNDVMVLTKNTYNPIIRNAQFGNIFYNGANDYIIYYALNDRSAIHRATSTDLNTWTVDAVNNPILTPSARTITVPNVWKEGSDWYMLYRSNEWDLGYDKIGLATSADGINWTKYVNNPVLEGAIVTGGTDASIDITGIIKVGSTYYGYVNDVGITPRSTTYVTSTDLINWTKHVGSPMFTNERYCASVCKYETYYYLAICYSPNGSYQTGAGNNRIEIYKDTDPTFNPTSRKYLGYIITGGGLGSWENNYLDTPNFLTTTIQRDVHVDDKLHLIYSGHRANGKATGWSIGHAYKEWSFIKNLPTLTEPLAGE